MAKRLRVLSYWYRRCVTLHRHCMGQSTIYSSLYDYTYSLKIYSAPDDFGDKSFEIFILNYNVWVLIRVFFEISRISGSSYDSSNVYKKMRFWTVFQSSQKSDVIKHIFTHERKFSRSKATLLLFRSSKIRLKNADSRSAVGHSHAHAHISLNTLKVH